MPAGGVHITDGFCLRGNRYSSRCQRLSRAEVHGRLSRPLNAYQLRTQLGQFGMTPEQMFEQMQRTLDRMKGELEQQT